MAASSGDSSPRSSLSFPCWLPESPAASPVGPTVSLMANEDALRSLNFPDNALLRGTCAFRVLRRRARIFKEKRPSTAKDYRLSAPVDHIDAFISHNWSTPRYQKFLSLALHFNLKPALVVAFCASVVVFGFQAFGSTPMFEEVFRSNVALVGVGCQLSSVCCFFLALFYVQEVHHFLPWRAPIVFLDKTCVHQTDEDLKRRGIECLPAYLSYSWSMVVLYSDIYLDKLWTVYELATFLLLFPDGFLAVQPMFFPKVVIGCFLTVCLSRCICFIYFSPTCQYRLKKSWGDSDELLWLIQASVFSPLLFGLTLMSRRWAKELRTIRRRVKNFSILNAACLYEADREVVEGNVATFSVIFGFVGPDASKANALSAFDSLVRRQVPRLLGQSVGNVGVPYRYAVTIFAVYVPYVMDHICGRIVEGKATVKGICCYLLWGIAVVFGVGPLTVALCYCVAKSTLFMRGPWSIVAVVVITCICVVFYDFLIIGVVNQLFAMVINAQSQIDGHDTVDWMIVFFVAVVAALVGTAVLIYRRPMVSRIRRRLDVSNEGGFEDRDGEGIRRPCVSNSECSTEYSERSHPF